MCLPTKRGIIIFPHFCSSAPEVGPFATMSVSVDSCTPDVSTDNHILANGQTSGADEWKARAGPDAKSHRDSSFVFEFPCFLFCVFVFLCLRPAPVCVFAHYEEGG